MLNNHVESLRVHDEISAEEIKTPTVKMPEVEKAPEMGQLWDEFESALIGDNRKDCLETDDGRTNSLIIDPKIIQKGQGVNFNDLIKAVVEDSNEGEISTAFKQSSKIADTNVNTKMVEISQEEGEENSGKNNCARGEIDDSKNKGAVDKTSGKEIPEETDSDNSEIDSSGTASEMRTSEESDSKPDKNANEELTEKNDTVESENNEEDGEQKELTEDEINELQKKAIQEAFERIARGEQLTDAEKGNLGEMLMDQYYIEQGYKPIHSPRVTDLQHKSGQGIDGVYEKVNPDGSKSYIIADAKVNHSQLNKGLADGTDQMSDAWVEKRLDDAVGKEKADEIRDAYEDDPGSVNKEVYHFSYYENGENTGVSDVSSVDRDGNREGSRVLVQTFDAEGNATYESNTSEDSHER